jgi:hypothetical protein
MKELVKNIFCRESNRLDELESTYSKLSVKIESALKSNGEYHRQQIIGSLRAELGTKDVKG